MSTYNRSSKGNNSIRAVGPNTIKPLHKEKPDQLSHENQELLKRFLITVSKGERSIERQRQVLAALQRFEPHSAFQRIDRDRDSKISSLEILKFLRDNGVEEATEADTYYVVKYFDSDQDEMLDYEDLMQMVMPCDDQNLRAAIAQRDIYEVTKHDFLNAEVEVELTRLLEKEIALNRVTEELKQEMDASKSFCIKKAFAAIDDWKYGYIDKKNLKSFLRKHNYVASTAECMAIIRRLDLDADARISKREFAEGLRPEEPYNKTMKRSAMKRGKSQQNAHHRKPRQGLSAKNGQILMLKNSERDEIRTLAMDKLHSNGRNGLMRGTTPLKSRPVMVHDLNMFSSPKLNKSRSKRGGKQRQPRQQHNNNTSHMEHRILRSARSSRSHRSLSRSVHKSQYLHTQQSQQSNFTRHASAIAGGRRKRDQKPGQKNRKALKSSRSRKSLKRQGSMDDMYIERLSKPRDHSKLIKRIQKEQRQEFLKQRPDHLRSRSRSARKSQRDTDDDKSVIKKYKTYMKKFGNFDSEDEDGSLDQWRGAFDFTRVSGVSNQEQFDDRRSFLQESKNKKKKEHRSNRKKNKIDKSELDRTSTSFGLSDPRSFLQSRDQSKERTNERPATTNYNQIIENQLSSIKKQIQASQPRQPVFSKHRQEVQNPKSILPRTEEAFFLRKLQEIILLEKDLEARKIDLSLRDDFNMIDAFGILDEDGKGNLNPQELHVALRKLEIAATQEDCYLFFIRYNKEVDGLLKYSEFTDAFMPVDQHYARNLGSKRLQYCQPPGRTTFCYETTRNFCEVWLNTVKVEQQVEVIKKALSDRPEFNIEQAFRSCDQSYTGSITCTDIKNLMTEYGLHISTEELQLLINRLDKNKDSKINFLEFKQGLTPQCPFLYQQPPIDRPLTDQELQQQFR